MLLPLKYAAACNICSAVEFNCVCKAVKCVNISSNAFYNLYTCLATVSIPNSLR